VSQPGAEFTPGARPAAVRPLSRSEQAARLEHRLALELPLFIRFRDVADASVTGRCNRVVSWLRPLRALLLRLP
jgi:hypothetical protein